MVCAQLQIVQENEKHKLLWDFEIKTHYLISARRLVTASDNQQKKIIYRIMDFALLVKPW